MPYTPKPYTTDTEEREALEAEALEAEERRAAQAPAEAQEPAPPPPGEPTDTDRILWLLLDQRRMGETPLQAMQRLCASAAPPAAPAPAEGEETDEQYLDRLLAEERDGFGPATADGFRAFVLEAMSINPARPRPGDLISMHWAFKAGKQYQTAARYADALLGPAPAPAAPAEALTMERYTRIAVQATMREPVGAPLLTWAQEGMDAAAALLTPDGRVQLIADLGRGLSPEDRRAVAQAFLGGLPSRDGESALSQVLRVCGDVAADEAEAELLGSEEGGPLTEEEHAAAAITGAEAAHEMLRDPARALAVAAELLAKVPHGIAGQWLSLGDGPEALAFLRGLPGAEVRLRLSPILMGGKKCVTESATIQIGALLVSAQDTRPATLDDARRLLEGGK